jgi:hypothetical protein
VIDGLPRDPDGKRIRKFFHSRDAATEWLSQRRPELQQQGGGALRMTDRQRVDALRALEILAPYGASLTVAARTFADHSELLSRTVTFEELRREIVEAKRADKHSGQYIHDADHRLKNASEKFDCRPVAAIEPRELDDWLRQLALSPTSRFNYRKVLRTAFQFAVDRGYARENPILKTRRRDSWQSGHSRPREVAALLIAADPRIVPALALRHLPASAMRKSAA